MTNRCQLFALLWLVSTVAAIPMRPSQLVSAMQNVQRQYEGRQAKDAAGLLQELTEEAPQEGEKEETGASDGTEQTAVPGASTKQAPVASARKQKMLGYYGLYAPPIPAAYGTPYGYPLYQSMLDYYDDYAMPVDNYPSLNMLANMQSYPPNMYANMPSSVAAAYQSPLAGAGPLSPNLQQQLNSLLQQQVQQQQQQQSQQSQQPQQATNPQLANLANLDANAASLGSFQSLAASFAAGNDHYQGLEDEDILSRHSQASRRRPGQVKNSPIYYIRLPPTPYMFVPGVGYISQPPTIQPMAAPIPQYQQLPPPVTMSPFYQLPINFVSNGKPSGIYQWNGGPAAAPAPAPPQFALPYPRPPRPAYVPQAGFIQDSKITHLKGPFLFNGRPEEIFLLQNAYNPLFQSPLAGYY
ncbi:uncharacterized protein LOC125948806 [Anopheles darlingi]|uniref:uncharacterized protein LOC125948806 n=1 Tax=Anopheles darlingi TaxID=43151 RepID=UPI0021000FB1|nr:uncharacterized protein LOC125948806 [Anopheles darlingi]